MRQRKYRRWIRNSHHGRGSRTPYARLSPVQMAARLEPTPNLGIRPNTVEIVMVPGKAYSIRGGAAGRERLRILSRVMSPSTASLFDRVAISEGQLCLDIGCGGGDVTMELARRVGPRGKAVGADIDETQLDIARREVDAKDIRNVEFRLLDIRATNDDIGSIFEIVYARLLLTHLDDPSQAVAAFYRYLRPGGHVILEDIDSMGISPIPNPEHFSDTVNSIAKWSADGAATQISGHACRSCSRTAALRRLR